MERERLNTTVKLSVGGHEGRARSPEIQLTDEELMEKYRQLAQVQTFSAFFTGLSTLENEALVNYIDINYYEPGQTIIQKKTVPSWIGVLCEGSVAIVKAKKELATLAEGDVIGDISVFSHNRSGLSTVDVVATSEVTMITLPHSVLEEINYENPDLGLKLYQICGRASTIKLQRQLVKCHGDETFEEFQQQKAEAKGEKEDKVQVALKEAVLALDEMPFGRDFNEEDLNALSVHARYYVFAPGSTIMMKSQLAHNVFVILKGEVEARVEKQVLGHKTTGGVFGEEAFILSFSQDEYTYVRPCDVVASKEAWVLPISQALLDALNDDHPKVAWKLYRWCISLALTRLFVNSQQAEKVEGGHVGLSSWTTNVHAAPAAPKILDDDRDDDDDNPKKKRPKNRGRSFKMKKPKSGSSFKKTVDLPPEELEEEPEEENKEADVLPTSPKAGLLSQTHHHMFSPAEVVDLLKDSARSSPYWRGFESGEYAVLAKNMTMLRVSEGDFVMKAEESATYFLYLIYGQARIMLGPDDQGQEQYKIVNEHQFMGHLGLFVGTGQRTASVVCDTDCVIALYKYQDLLDFHESSPELGVKIIKQLGLAAITAVKDDMLGAQEYSRFEALPKLSSIMGTDGDEHDDEVEYKKDLFQMAIQSKDMELDEEECEMMAATCDVHLMEQGEHAVKRGQRSSCLIVVLEGVLETKAESEDSSTISLITKGEFLGTTAILHTGSIGAHHNIRGTNVYCASKRALVAFLTIDQLIEMNYNKPSLALKIFIRAVEIHISHLVLAIQNVPPPASRLPPKKTHKKKMQRMASRKMPIKNAPGIASRTNSKGNLESASFSAPGAKDEAKPAGGEEAAKEKAAEQAPQQEAVAAQAPAAAELFAPGPQVPPQGSKPPEPETGGKDESPAEGEEHEHDHDHDHDEEEHDEERELEMLAAAKARRDSIQMWGLDIVGESEEHGQPPNPWAVAALPASMGPTPEPAAEEAAAGLASSAHAAGELRAASEVTRDPGASEATRRSEARARRQRKQAQAAEAREERKQAQAAEAREERRQAQAAEAREARAAGPKAAAELVQGWNGTPPRSAEAPRRPDRPPPKNNLDANISRKRPSSRGLEAPPPQPPPQQPAPPLAPEDSLPDMQEPESPHVPRDLAGPVLEDVLSPSMAPPYDAQGELSKRRANFLAGAGNAANEAGQHPPSRSTSMTQPTMVPSNGMVPLVRPASIKAHRQEEPLREARKSRGGARPSIVTPRSERPKGQQKGYTVGPGVYGGQGLAFFGGSVLPLPLPASTESLPPPRSSPELGQGPAMQTVPPALHSSSFKLTLRPGTGDAAERKASPALASPSRPPEQPVLALQPATDRPETYRERASPKPAVSAEKPQAGSFSTRSLNARQEPEARWSPVPDVDRLGGGVEGRRMPSGRLPSGDSPPRTSTSPVPSQPHRVPRHLLNQSMERAAVTLPPLKVKGSAVDQASPPRPHRSEVKGSAVDQASPPRPHRSESPRPKTSAAASPSLDIDNSAVPLLPVSQLNMLPVTARSLDNMRLSTTASKDDSPRKGHMSERSTNMFLGSSARYAVPPKYIESALEQLQMHRRVPPASDRTKLPTSNGFEYAHTHRTHGELSYVPSYHKRMRGSKTLVQATAGVDSLSSSLYTAKTQQSFKFEPPKASKPERVSSGRIRARIATMTTREVIANLIVNDELAEQIRRGELTSRGGSHKKQPLVFRPNTTDLESDELPSSPPQYRTLRTL